MKYSELAICAGDTDMADLPLIGAALSRGVFQKGSRILDLGVSFDWE